MDQGRALAELVAGLLNAMLKKSPEVAGELIEPRLPAPKVLADHPHVQTFLNSEGVLQVSILGLLNGFFGGWVVAYHHTGGFRVIRPKKQK